MLQEGLPPELQFDELGPIVDFVCEAVGGLVDVYRAGEAEVRRQQDLLVSPSSTVAVPS